MKPLLGGGEEDEEGRLVIRMGGQCPVCGKGPDMKYASNGKAVLYHLPVECQEHARRHAYVERAS